MGQAPVALFFVGLLLAAVSGLSGSLPLPSSISLSIPNILATIHITEDAILTSPKISYNIEGVTDLVRSNSTTIIFDAYAISPSSSSHSTSGKPDGVQSNANSLSSLPVFLSVLVGTLAFPSHPRYAAALSAFSLLAFSYTHADSTPTLELTISVPPNFHFDYLGLHAPHATITSDIPINSDVLILDLCSGTGATVSFPGVKVFRQLDVCASGDVTVHKIRTISNNVKISLVSSEGSVTSSFLSGYFGSYEAHSEQNIYNFDGDCVHKDSEGGKYGTCGSKSFSSAIFSARNSIEINFGHGCSADWLGDPSAQDVIPPKGTPANYVPTYAVNVSDGDPSSWSYYMQRGQQNGYSYAGTGDDAGAAVVYQEGWANRDNHVWYTMPKRVLPKIYEGLPYTITFEAREGPDNYISPNNAWNFTRFSVVFFENPESVWHKAESKWNWWIMDEEYVDPTYSLGFCDVDPSLVGNPNYTLANCTLVPTRTSTNAVVALRGVNQNMNTETHRYFFRNLVVITPLTPVTLPTLLEKDSELVILRKPSPDLEANPRGAGDCPHLRGNLKFWHDPATWGGAVPSPSLPSITLPPNTAVLLSSCSLDPTAIYGRIVIPASSSLIFDDAPIEWHVRDVYVMGEFLIGSPTCRIFSNITITFHGKNDTSDTIAPGHGYGSKGIAVEQGGRIEIHGKQFHHTWSRMASSAAGGDDRVYLMDDVNWEVGQKIVVTATILNDEEYNQNEVVTITVVQGRTIVFTPPLRYFHYGGQEYQAEIGLLDRRITIQGNFADSEADNSSFGGHILVRGKGLFSGVKFQRMGQLNRLARYPVHYHMVEYGGKGSYVADSSFHRCFFRCVSIHGTYETLVTRNVAFDIKGHCYYLEDGTEENNTLSYNLAAYIHPVGRPATGFGQAGEWMDETPDLSQPADSAAAGFYITNAYNRIIGNAASGGWAGFSFPNLMTPIQFNAYRAPFDPSGRPTLEFDGNTARGSGNIFGNSGCIYVGGWLVHSGNDNNTGTTLLHYQNGRVERTTRWQIIPTPSSGDPKANLTFTNTKTSLCTMGVGDWSDCQLINYESHDNYRAAMLFGKSWMGNALVVGRTANPLSGTPPLGTRQGFEFYDTYTHTILTNVTFRNFHLIPNLTQTDSDPHNDNKIFVSMTHSDVFKPEGMSVARNITFENVDPDAILGVYRQDTGSSRMFNLYDTDNSITKHMGIQNNGLPVIIGSYPTWWNFSPSCVFNSAWNAWVCPRQYPEQEILNIGLYVPGFIDYGVSNQAYDYVGLISLFGNGISSNDNRSLVVTRNSGITGVSHLGWYFELHNGAPAETQINTIQIPKDSWFMFAAPYPAGTVFDIQTRLWDNIWLDGYHNMTQAPTFEDVLHGNGTTYYWDNSHLYVKVIDQVVYYVEDFYRDGAVVHSYNNGFIYKIKAYCPSTWLNSDNVTFCNNTPTTRPSHTW